MRILGQWVRSRLFAAIAGALLGGIIGLIPSFVMWHQQGDESRQEDSIQQLVNKEAECVLKRDLDGVLSLFAEDAVVFDAGKGEKWVGKSSIRVRYMNLEQFSYLKHGEIRVQLGPGQERATAYSDTIGGYFREGKEVTLSSYQGDKWTFRIVNGEWKIDTFSYGLPSST